MSGIEFILRQRLEFDPHVIIIPYSKEDDNQSCSQERDQDKIFLNADDPCPLESVHTSKVPYPARTLHRKRKNFFLQAVQSSQQKSYNGSRLRNGGEEKKKFPTRCKVRSRKVIVEP